MYCYSSKRILLAQVPYSITCWMLNVFIFTLLFMFFLWSVWNSLVSILTWKLLLVQVFLWLFLVLNVMLQWNTKCNYSYLYRSSLLENNLTEHFSFITFLSNNINNCLVLTLYYLFTCPWLTKAWIRLSTW